MLSRIQTGGGRQRGVRCPIREGIVETNGFRYKYECIEDDENTILFRGGGKRPCFLLHIRPAEKEAVLLGFERALNCSLNDHAPIKSAARAAFELARQRGVQHFELSDEATRDSSLGKRFVLSDMEFLTSGVAWYESCLPVRPVAAAIPLVESWRSNASRITWQTVSECLQTQFPSFVCPVPLDDIDVTKEGSGMAVFSRIKAAKTDFFSDYRYALPSCIGAKGSLFGVVWEASLPAA
jgi:hypothetical protein